ncbi:PucR family transcriptional regulator [Pradoshia sp.]
MNTDLRKLFPDLIQVPYPLEDSSYLWYIDKQHGYIGIPKESINTEQKAVLEMFLEPFTLNSGQLNMTAAQSIWHDLLYRENLDRIKEAGTGSYRFIHFYLASNDTNRVDFSSAIYALFPDAVLCWKDRYSGVVVEKSTASTMTNKDFGAIIDTLESDLYAHLRLFIGNYYPVNERMVLKFQAEETCFNVLSLTNPKLRVTSFTSAFVDLILTGQNQELCRTLAQNILGTIGNETDLLETIKIYIESNANATVAAKKLFLHRNSLNYRLDKFFEITSLDVKQFEDSLCAYLAIRLLEGWGEK